MDLDVLEDFLAQCNNLEKLEVAETGLTIKRMLSHILPHCPSVTSLSFSLRPSDKSTEDYKMSYGDPTLHEGVQILKNLRTVEIITLNCHCFLHLNKFL